MVVRIILQRRSQVAHAELLRKISGVLVLSLSAVSAAIAQAPPDVPLIGKLNAGMLLRYEIEATTAYSAETAENYKPHPELGPCQYSLFAVVTLSVGPVASDGNTPVKAEYRDPRITSWECSTLKQEAVTRNLLSLATTPIIYQIGPHGEVGFQGSTRDRFSYESPADLLSRLTLDILQTRLADHPVAIGSFWKPFGQFTYWRDHLLSGLELSAATMRWKSTPTIAGRDCALVTSKYVFAPTESPGGPVTSGGKVRTQATNVVAGTLGVSLLFDLRDSRIVWLSRSYKVVNHVSAQPDQEDDPEIATIHWAEEGKARFISESDSVEWMAAIKKFETTLQLTPTVAPPVAGAEPSVADLARAAVPKKKSGNSEVDTLDVTPHGFARWEREFCNSSWYCTRISVALPGAVKIVEDGLRAVYLAKSGGSAFTVTVGPALQREYRGLTAEEELKKHSDSFLANRLWMMNQPGISLDSENRAVDGYPARITSFRGERRDLVTIQGELAVLLSPWGEAFPVTCTLDQHNAEQGYATCERILELIRMRRHESGR